MSAAPVRIPLFQKYDPSATTDLIFGVFGPDLAGTKPALTSGSSTTVTKVTAGDNPFLGLQVGGEISVNRDGTWDVVYVTTFTDAENIVVSSAVNWQVGPQGSVGRHFHFRPFLAGQTASDGWFNAQEFDRISIGYVLSTINATSITLQIEGRIKGPQMSPITIFSTSLTAIGEDLITVTEHVDELRVGLLVVTDTGAQDISVYALCEPRVRW